MEWDKYFPTIHITGDSYLEYTKFYKCKYQENIQPNQNLVNV